MPQLRFCQNNKDKLMRPPFVMRTMVTSTLYFIALSSKCQFRPHSTFTSYVKLILPRLTVWGRWEMTLTLGVEIYYLRRNCIVSLGCLLGENFNRMKQQSKSISFFQVFAFWTFHNIFNFLLHRKSQSMMLWYARKLLIINIWKMTFQPSVVEFA